MTDVTGEPKEPQTRSSVAMLIDWENISLTLQEDYDGLVVDPIALRKAARRWGRLVDARAYADWRDAAWEQDVDMLDDQGIQPVLVRTKRRAEAIKNAVDLRMATDLVLLAAEGDVDAIILVSGDGDFVAPLLQAKARGPRIVVITPSTAADPRLTYLLDAFIAYEELVGLSDNTHAALGRDELLTLVGECAQRLIDAGEPATAAAVKLRLAARQSGFDEEEYGFPSFVHLLATAEAHDLLRLDTTVSPPRAYPADATRSETDVPLLRPDMWRNLIEHFDAYRPRLVFHRDLNSYLHEQEWGTQLSCSATRLRDAVTRSGVINYRSTTIAGRQGRQDVQGYQLNTANPRLHAYAQAESQAPTPNA